jgi:hypothetical protein
MARASLFVTAFVATTVLVSEAQRQTAPPAGSTITTAVKCAADLGRGEKSRRQFCDVVIGGAGPQSIVIPVPAHRGDAVLMFDLHNRFTVPAGSPAPGDAFARQTAVVAVTSPAGEVLGRAVVSREYRTVDDLFDRIGGGGRTGGLKAVAPGYAEAIRVTISAAVSAVGIVGLRLEETTRTGLASFETPGRPVAIASNFRVEYIPR